MTNKRSLKESAAAGAVSAGSVAVRTDIKGRDDYPTQKRDIGFLKYLQNRRKKIANGLNMKEIKTPFPVSLKENVSLDQIYSKLGGVQNQSRMHEDNTQTYGVEDDDGNLMKITIRGDQQDEFESALAQELAEVEEYKMTGRSGHGGNVSMAEVLYNLKQNFDIVNVEFPEIPKDKIYNADKVSEPDELDTLESQPNAPSDDESIDGEEGFDDGQSAEGEDEELNDVDFGDEESEEEGEEDLGTDFGSEDDEESMLKNIVNMLSSEAEARRAQYEAEAEKSRALQAKYSMKAAQEEMENQEELARMEQEMKQQKEKEKEAKKLSDLAKFKMRGGTVSESFYGFGDFLVHMLENEDSGVDAASLRRQRREVSNIKDPQERALKQRKLNAQIRLAQDNERKEGQDNQNDAEDSSDSNRRGQNKPNNISSPNRRSGGILS